MNKNIIWLAIGAVGAYLLLSRKKASATKVEEPPKDGGSTEPPKDGGRTTKEPRSQADCLEGERFSPSQNAEDIILTKKDGTTEIVKQEAKPASCIKIWRGLTQLPLPQKQIPYGEPPIEYIKERLATGIN